MAREVFTKVILKLRSFTVWRRELWKKGTNASKELAAIHFRAEVVGDKFSPNISTYVPNCTVSHPE
jgi:hypothetical protein